MYAIEIQNLSKSFRVYSQPVDRLKEIIFRRSLAHSIESLKDVNLQVLPGETIGIIGKNGAGKSTLLKLVAGTLTPSSGTININGRVAALLELGAGFNPEFSGRKNIFMNAALLGLKKKEIKEREPLIIKFSELAEFIDRPLKIYSSGMALRLAFAVAVNVDPDILIIDEALSVGDGSFARKSFDKIMQFKNNGKAILFCSHSLYQVEALCDRALWIDAGKIVQLGKPADVIKSYNEFMATQEGTPLEGGLTHNSPLSSFGKTTAIKKITVSVDGNDVSQQTVMNKVSELAIEVCFCSDPNLPVPSIGVCLTGRNGAVVSSASTQNDHYEVLREQDGSSRVTVCFPEIALLKGRYGVDVYLMCENGVHFYDHALSVASIDVEQEGLEIGVVSLKHSWMQ